MGILTGKFNPESTFSEDDVRTLAQAALGWIWARSERTIPIPGFKTVKQVEENAKALELGLLGEEQVSEIKRMLENEQTE